MTRRRSMILRHFLSRDEKRLGRRGTERQWIPTLPDATSSALTSGSPQPRTSRPAVKALQALLETLADKRVWAKPACSFW